MPGLSAVSVQHQHGPQANIWPSCCSRRSRGPGRRWASARLLTHQEQVRNHVGRGFGDPRDPIALTCCAPLNPRRWRTGASCPSTTSPLYHKAALAMYFRPWGVASCLLVQFLLAQLAKEAREKAAMAGRVSVPLSGPRQSGAPTAAADDPPRSSSRCATPGSPSLPVLGAFRRTGPCAFGGDLLQTGITARKPPPPRRSHAAGSRRSAWFGGRYGQWGS